MKIYPDNSNFQINDTFWLELNIPTNFTDIVLGKTIDFRGAQNFGTIVGFVDYSKFNNPIAAADSFSTYLLEGTKVDNPQVDQIREYLFSEVNGSYVFKLGIIPKRKGTFGIGVGNSQNVYRTSDKCTKAFFNIILQNTLQHYKLNPNINSSNTDTTKPSGSYRVPARYSAHNLFT